MNDAPPLSRFLLDSLCNGVDLSKTPLTLGQHLKIDGESFAENAAASTLLARTYRKPFELPRV